MNRGSMRLDAYGSVCPTSMYLADFGSSWGTPFKGYSNHMHRQIFCPSGLFLRSIRSAFPCNPEYRR